MKKASLDHSTADYVSIIRIGPIGQFYCFKSRAIVAVAIAAAATVESSAILPSLVAVSRVFYYCTVGKHKPLTANC